MATPPMGRGFPGGAWGLDRGSDSDDSEADEPSFFQGRTTQADGPPTAAPVSPTASMQQLSLTFSGAAPGSTSRPRQESDNGDDVESHLVALTQRLLDAIAAGDYSTYRALCDPSLSAFEPEARGGLVQGLEFHRFYFSLPRPRGPSPNQTMVSPTTRLIGDSAAVVTYTRLSQSFNPETQVPTTSVFEETRVWEKKERGWVNVHFHRSIPSS